MIPEAGRRIADRLVEAVNDGLREMLIDGRATPQQVEGVAKKQPEDKKRLAHLMAQLYPVWREEWTEALLAGATESELCVLLQKQGRKAAELFCVGGAEGM